MKYKIALISLVISLNLFSDQCNIDLVTVNSGVENAKDYELRKNYKYAIIELNEAIIYAKQAVEDCENTLTKKEIERLKRDIKSFSVHQEKLKKYLK